MRMNVLFWPKHTVYEPGGFWLVDLELGERNPEQLGISGAPTAKRLFWDKATLCD